MNKIFKVIYSKTRHCYVVVSELAKSHCKTAGSHTTRNKTALTAAVLLALGAFSFAGMPVAQADESLLNNDFIGANDYYWYYDEKTGEWKTYQYKPTDIFNNRSRHDLPNYQGGGAKLPGAVTAGLYAQAGQQTITIGDRNAGQSKGSVFIGERSGYNNGDNVPAGLKNNYVTSVGFQSDATGWGSIAIGSNATAENSKMDSQVVKEVGNANTSGTVKDDTYGIEGNPTIQGASVALGYDAHSKDGNIAIGAYSDATTDLSADTSDKAKAYLTKETAASYVSVGSSDVKRRIMNVADGAADSDVATIGQLKKMSEKAGVYNEGWGIKIGDYTKKDANGTETTVKNAISVDRNLGSNEITTKSKNTFKAAGENSLILGGAGTDDLVYINGSPRETQFGAYGKDSVLVGGENNKITDAGTYAVISGGGQNIASGEKSFIGGGWWNTAKGATSTVLGGQSNTASGNQSTIVGGDTNRAIGIESSILGGFNHTAIGDHSTISGGDGAYTFGTYSSVSGGQGNVAIGVASSADGGWLNYSYGDYSQANGGYSNYTLGNASSSLGGRNGVVQGNVSVGIAGGSTEAGAGYALAAGYQSVVTAAGVHREKSNDVVDSYLEAGNNTGGNEGYKYTDVATALGYQATADAPNTVSFGHDKGDVSGYTVNWDYEFETDTQGNIKFDENGMPLVKSMKPNSITTNYYDTAKYNRLVKAADGIEDHDAVVMEQLKNASDVGNNIKVYKTDENGNVQFDTDNNPIEDTSDTATKKKEAAQKASEDAWGKAIGTGKVEAKNSQLVTGDTVFNAIQDKAVWKLTTNGEAADKAATIKPGTTVDFSADKNTKNHSNVTISHDGSNVTIGLDKDVVLGEASKGKGGSLNVYSDSSDANNLSNHVSITGSTISVNYPKIGTDGKTTTDTRGVVIGVGEDSNGNGDGYIAFNNFDGHYTYLHSATDAADNLKDRLEYVGTTNEPKYIANLDDGITFAGDVAGTVPDGSKKTLTKLNTTINVVGGAKTEANLTEGNIGVVSTPAAEDNDGNQTQASKLEIKLNKDLKGITSISNQTTTDGTTTGAKIDLAANGTTTISGGDVNVSNNKVTGLKDGENDTDAVTVKQLNGKANVDASNLGNNIKVYKTDENGNVQLGDDKKPIEDKDATTTAQKANKDAWGKALGAGTLSTADAAKNSDQLVTGKTLYDYDAPVAETGKKLTYVSANKTTGQNLTALDAQVAANTSTLNDKNHNIKYYSVNDQAPLSKIDGYSNEGNDGAKGRGSIAAGFNTHADGVISTVVGSYSGVLNQNGNSDFRGATALSYGTFNINQNTDPKKSFSGVANSIIGQANATTNSNAAIIYGAGNTVTNSYRGIYSTNVSDIMNAFSSKDVKKIDEALQKAVPTSGGQVMVMGGGNSVDKAYMTQVTGVGNKVSGQNSIYEKGTSTQYNFVDGFQNELSNGQHDYIIGTENKVSGDSVDKNQSNIIFGDNHKLTNQTNNVIIGSSDKADDETTVSDIVAIGHNAKVSAEGGVAIGSGSAVAASTEKVSGYDPTTKAQSTDKTSSIWNATTGAVSIGTADGTVTRQLNGVAAGTNDTDAVNVAQLKKLEGMKANIDASNIGNNLKGADGKTASPEEITANKNDWGTALGVGMVADPTQSTTNDPTKNGSQQLVTGGTVFNETRISAKDDQGKAKTYNYLDVNASAGKNLEALDSALKTVSTTAGAHTALTVEGNTPAGKGKDAKTDEDVYAGKNILLHESTDEKTGKVTYDLKLSKDINIGKPGKDGEDGKIGIDGKDGHIGLNGSDGITVRGLDGENGAPGKDGVTITGPKGEAGKDGIDGKVGISGKDGNDAVSISGKDGVGHIGLTGPAGTNGMNGADGKPGTSIDITVKNGYDGKTGTDGKDGVKGEKGVDGTSLTRIVYTDGAGEHQVATMEDGLKFKGDDTTVIAKKLNNTLEIIGGAKGDLTDGNIGVNSTKDGKLKVQLSKNLTGMNSITYTTTTGEGESATTSTTVVNGNGLTITNGPSITNKGVDGGNKVITNVGSGIEADKNGKYTVTDQNKGNAANIGDVQNMVNDAKTELTDGANGLNKKANIDASNIGANLKGADGKAASAEEQKTNAEKWGSAIGTGEIKADDGRMVTGKTVYDEVRPTEDGNYVKKNKTTGENLSALDSKIGKLDETKKYNYIDSGKDVSISDNLTKLDTQVKNNADAIQKNSESIQNITNNVKNLSDNAVQYDKDSNKTKVTLGGEGGTTITHVMDGALSENSSDAVNGKQLYNEQQAREAADKAITEKVTNNTNEITKIENGEGFTDAGKTVIKNLSKDAVQVKAGDRIKVDKATDDQGNKTYTISADNNGKVAKDDGNLISGDTLYKEVHVDKDGSYIKGSNTVGQNLSALDTGLKTTSDLIHTNDKGDTIQIGGNSTATKIDVSGKDANGNTTGRVITGVVSDASDPNSAANVGYVNGLTAANTQQIYRDMNNAYSRLDTNINRAAAGSNALAALHPLDFDPADKASFAVGYGHYHNANAAAVGAFYQPNANTMVNMGISLGNGDPGFNAGVSFKIGKGSAYNGVSKAEMAQTIHDQAAEISTIKANDAAKDKRIDALEKENQEMKKQIQEILARLNG